MALPPRSHYRREYSVFLFPASPGLTYISSKVYRSQIRLLPRLRISLQMPPLTAVDLPQHIPKRPHALRLFPAIMRNPCRKSVGDPYRLLHLSQRRVRNPSRLKSASVRLQGCVNDRLGKLDFGIRDGGPRGRNWRKILRTRKRRKRTLVTLLSRLRNAQPKARSVLRHPRQPQRPARVLQRACWRHRAHGNLLWMSRQPRSASPHHHKLRPPLWPLRL